MLAAIGMVCLLALWDMLTILYCLLLVLLLCD